MDKWGGIHVLKLQQIQDLKYEIVKYRQPCLTLVAGRQFPQIEKKHNRRHVQGYIVLNWHATISPL